MGQSKHLEAYDKSKMWVNYYCIIQKQFEKKFPGVKRACFFLSKFIWTKVMFLKVAIQITFRT